MFKKKQIGKSIIILLLLILFTINIFPENEKDYVAGEFIIKVNKETGKKIRSLMTADSLVVKNISNVNIEINFDELNKLCNIKEISPVHTGLVLQMLKENKTAEDIYKETLEKFPKRKKRVLFDQKGNMEIPDIENIFLLKVDIDADIPKIILEYQKLDCIIYAEPNYLIKMSFIPDDPFFGYDPKENCWGVKKIECEKAWDLSMGEDVIVAIIDSGVDYNHDDLKDNIWINENEIPDNGIDDDENGYIDDYRGYNVVKKNGEVNDESEDSHGTCCAGIIAASSNNIGVVGVAPKAKIMIINGHDITISGEETISNVSEGIYYAVQYGADIINCSFGVYAKYYESAFKYAYSQGVIVVAAAGNESKDAASHFPSGYDSVISVSGLDENDTPVSYSNYGDTVDVAAPTEVYTTYKNNLYRNFSGTSAAAPHVSGLTALLVSYYDDPSNPEYSDIFNNFTNYQDAIRFLIKFSTDSFPDKHLVPMGTGRINAFNALTMTPSPRFRYDGFKYKDYGDNDFIIEEYEDIEIIVELDNIGLPCDTVSLSLESENNPAVDIIKSVSTAENSITEPMKLNNENDPFIIKINNLNENEFIDIKITVQNTEGSYQTFTDTICIGARKISDMVYPGYISCYDEKAVFFEYQKNSTRYSLYNLTTNEKIILAQYNEDKKSAHKYFERPKIYKNNVVWSYNNKLYLYHLNDNHSDIISGDNSYKPNYFNKIDFRSSYDIYENKIVWEDKGFYTTDGNGSNIYLYDTASMTKQQITYGKEYKKEPSIYENIIVWKEFIDESDYKQELFLYDMNSMNPGEKTQITHTNASTYQKNNIKIFKDKIVWADDRNGNWDIYMYDLNINEEIRITDDPGTEQKPDIYGNYIVWQGSGESAENQYIFVYDIEKKIIVQHTMYNQLQINPCIYKNKIFWIHRILSDENKNDLRHFYSLYMTEITGNTPPVIDPVDDINIYIGESIEFQINALDPDGDPLLYSAENLPEGAVFNPVTGIFKLSEEYTKNKMRQNVIFSVTDGDFSVKKEIYIRVTPKPLLGDVNTDGKIDVVDALSIARYSNGLSMNRVFNPEYADVNADGKIDETDSLTISQYYVKLITEFSGSLNNSPYHYAKLIPDTNGTTEYNFGIKTAISDNGKTIVSAYKTDKTNERETYLTVYSENDNFEWKKDNITYDFNNLQNLQSFCISGDGNTIAFADPDGILNGYNCGIVFVYDKNDNGEWIKNEKRNIFLIENQDRTTKLGEIIKISDDGNTIVTTGHFINTNNIDTQIVYVYNWNNTDKIWENTYIYNERMTLKIQDISITIDGKIIAIMYNERTELYLWAEDLNKWVYEGGFSTTQIQHEYDINNPVSIVSFDLSDQIKYMPIIIKEELSDAEIKYNLCLSKITKSYTLSGSTVINEELAEIFQIADICSKDTPIPEVSISDDGNNILVSDPVNNKVLYFNYDGTNWKRNEINAIDGKAGDSYGKSVKFSGDGKTFIVGAPNDDNIWDDSGAVYIYDKGLNDIKSK